MKKQTNKIRLITLLFAGIILLNGCGSTAPLLSTPIENIDQTAVKLSEMSEEESRSWSHLDLIKDSIPGVSLDRAYDELVKPNGETVVVAVIDSGIDILHEDLKANVWINEGEIPDNGIDDDKNGYIDDVNGWNFLGDSTNEQLEYVRLLASKDRSNPRFEEAKALHEKDYKKYIEKIQLEFPTVITEPNIHPFDSRSDK